MPTGGQTIAKTLEQAARTLPDVTCGVACQGTSLEARTFAVGKKAFLFLGEKDARLKLAESAAEARQYSAGVAVGQGGWTRLSLSGDASLTTAILKRWVTESHRLAAGETCGGQPTKKRPTKR